MSALLLRLARFTRMPHMPPDPPNNGHHQQDADYEIKSMEQGLKPRILVPALAQLLAHIGQAKAPRKRSRKRVDNKFLQIHAGDAGGERDESANSRKQTAHKNESLAESREPPIGKIQIMMRDQHILSVLFDQRASAVHADPVSDQRAHHAAERTGDAYQ